MSSAKCFNLAQCKILSSGNGLKFNIIDLDLFLEKGLKRVDPSPTVICLQSDLYHRFTRSNCRIVFEPLTAKCNSSPLVDIADRDQNA